MPRLLAARDGVQQATRSHSTQPATVDITSASSTCMTAGSATSPTTARPTSGRAGHETVNGYIFPPAVRAGASSLKHGLQAARRSQRPKKGGLEAFESPDEKHLYYVRADEKPENIGIWQVPVNGGDEVAWSIRVERGNFAVTKNGIFVIDPLAKPAATISFYSFASRRLQRIGQLPDGSRMAPSKIAVSPDEKWILSVQYDQWGVTSR